MAFDIIDGAAKTTKRPIHMHQRLGVFVDVQNLFYSAKSSYQKKVDYDALLRKVVAGRALVRAIAYIVQTKEVDQKGFINQLLEGGYEVKSRELKRRPDGSAKGDWDMGIAIDSIALADRIDVMILVSGDGDFCDLIRHLKARGVRCEVYAFPQSTAEDLRRTSTEFVPLDSDVLLYDKK